MASMTLLLGEKQELIMDTGSSGVTLSQEEKAALQTSLILVQHDENFSDVFFWGKILGLGGDYFLVQGINETMGVSQKQTTGTFPTRRTLYSRDCVRWGLLTPATEEIMEKANTVRGRFSGDPSHQFEVTISSIRNEKLPNQDPFAHSALGTDSSTKLKEEDRLAAVVASIDRDVVIVPRGAYVRNSIGEIYRNRTFEGLSFQEATKLQHYFHFRNPVSLTNKTLLQRANLNSSIDFMDNIEEVIPNGRWSLQMERGGRVVILRNLDWLGYTFFHIPDTKDFGSVYFGTGERNIDMPFML